MFPLYWRLSLYSLSFLHFSRFSYALVFSTPTIRDASIFELLVTWTMSTGDPPDFNLNALCSSFVKIPLISLVGGSVPTSTMSVFVHAESLDIPLGIQFSLPCVVQALDVNTNAVIATSPDFSVELGGTSSLSTVPPPPPPTSNGPQTSPPVPTTSFSSPPPPPPTQGTTQPASPVSSSSVSPILKTTGEAVTQISPSSLSIQQATSTFSSPVSGSTLSMNFGSTVGSLVPSGSQLEPSSVSDVTVVAIPTSSGSHAPSNTSQPVAAIVGGSVGGVVVVGVMAFIIFLVRRKKSNSSTLSELDRLRNEEWAGSTVDEEWFGPPVGTAPPPSRQNTVMTMNPTVESGQGALSPNANPAQYPYNQDGPYSSDTPFSQYVNPMSAGPNIRYNNVYTAPSFSASRSLPPLPPYT